MSRILGEELENVQAEFRYPDAKSFRAFIEALSKILDEARFEISSDGVRVVGMDPAKVAYMEVYMPSSSFTEFNVETGGEPVYMGVNLETMSNILKKGKKGETLLFKVASDKIFVQIDSVIVKRFLIPNIEVILDVPEEIKLEHSVEATVISDVVKKAISDIEIVGDVAEFEASEDRLIIRAKGASRARVETILQEGVSSALLYLEVREPSTSLYDVSYLKNILNLTRVADSVDIKFSSGKPLEMIFRSPEGSQVRYILAPSVA